MQTSTQDDNVQIHAYTKDVRSTCLLGHIARISLHIYAVEVAMASNHRAPSRLIAPAKRGNVGVER
jgi:hypothetical protein